MNIAVDAMGGDHAPDAPIGGALEAISRRPDLEVWLVGNREQLVADWWERIQAEPRIRWVDASEVIETAEAPVQAVRQKRDSSLVKTIRLVDEGKAVAAISAGNTGALMAAGLFILGRLPGIERPALSAILPTFHSWGVLMLDVGANLDPTAQQLYQYGVMGSLYCQEVYGISSPRVALVNVGVEPEKGPQVVRQAYAKLESDPDIHFIGNLEPRELMQGHADVAIMDGFSGNITLKAIEGVARDIFREVRQELTRGWQAKLGALLLKSGLTRLKGRFDYQDQGGAPLLGLNQLVYKCHGSSEARAFARTIEMAADYAAKDTHERIRQRIQEGAKHEATGSGHGSRDLRS